MFKKLFVSLAKITFYRAHRPTHQKLILTIIKDSAVCPRELNRCVQQMRRKTTFITGSRLSLSSQFAHDLGLVNTKHRGGIAFVFDELYTHIYKYRDTTTAYQVYCNIGKVLDGIERGVYVVDQVNESKHSWTS